MHPSFIITFAATLCLLGTAATAKDWRPNEGKSPVRIGTAGTLAIGAQQPPTRPPGAVGAKANVSQNKFDFLSELGGISGFPCQDIGGINLCGENRDDDTAILEAITAADQCPVAQDITGKHGDIYSITSSTAHNLPCGGTVTLDTVPVSVVPSPDRIAIPDGDRVTIYRRSTNGVYDFIVDETRELPDNLCDASGGVVMPMPILDEQIIYFDQTANSILLQANVGAENVANANNSVATAINTAGLPYGFEDRLRIPLSGGRIDLNSQCPEADDWIASNVANPNSVEFIPSSSDPSCQDVTVELGNGQCLGQLQYMNLDTPALVHQPGVNATFLTIQGYPRMLTATADTSYVMMQNGSALRINASAGEYIVSEGGHMNLTGGNILRMSAPATITPATGRVKLTSGGYIESAAGVRLQDYPAGSIIVPSASLPLTIFPERKVILPAGMLLPIKDDATLRLPLAAPF